MDIFIRIIYKTFLRLIFILNKLLNYALFLVEKMAVKVDLALFIGWSLGDGYVFGHYNYY